MNNGGPKKSQGGKIKGTERDHLSLAQSKHFNAEDFGHHFNARDFINKSFDTSQIISHGSSI